MAATGHDYRLKYRRGVATLKRIGWHPKADEMLRLPSLAKRSPARVEGEGRAALAGVSWETMAGDIALAARIWHFISISGRKADRYFLSGRCPLDEKKIGLLSRRMPPFIRAKLDALFAGSINVVSNPTGAFDTDGWGELRKRIPKFRASMEHHTAGCCTSPTKAGLTAIQSEKIRGQMDALLLECVRFQELTRWADGQGDGVKRKASKNVARKVDWSKAHIRFAQILGVLKKSNRDLASKHWKKEWVPTKVDLSVLKHDSRALEESATTIIHWLAANR